MIETTTSLMQTGQELLWTDDQIPRELRDAESVEGQYSGERLIAQRPDTYRAIVYLLASGVTRQRIAEILKVHHKTVAAVANREGGAIAAQKRELAELARHGVAMALDSVLDDLAQGKIKPGKDKSIVLGILTDTMGKLEQGTSGFDGAAFTGSTPGHEAYDEFLSGLTEAERAALAKMGRAAEIAGAKERAANPAIEAEFTMQDEEVSE